MNIDEEIVAVRKQIRAAHMQAGDLQVQLQEKRHALSSLRANLEELRDRRRKALTQSESNCP